MPAIALENVRPLIAEQNVEGRTFQYVFTCPVSGRRVSASHTIQDAPGASGQVAQRAKRALGFSLRGPIASAIRRAFGTSTVGRMLGDVGSTVAYVATTPTTQGSKQGFSSEQKARAAVEAFRTVVTGFVWDEARASWISAESMEQLASPFELQLAKHPLEGAWDREVTARMLVEVASADGRLDPREVELLDTFLDPTLGGVEKLGERAALSRAELNECSAGAVRMTMLMLAWALALSDEDFDAAERERLEHFAHGLDQSAPDAERAHSAAQGYLLDQALERAFDAGRFDAGAREEMLALADRLGLDRSEAQIAEARFQKRRGM